MTWEAYALIAFFFLGAFYTSMKFATSIGISPELAVIILQSAGLITVFGYYLLTRSKLTLQYSQLSLTYAVAAGVFVGVANIAIYLALNSGPVSKISPITGMAIIIPALFGLFYFKEPISFRLVLGLVLASVSIFLLST